MANRVLVLLVRHKYDIVRIVPDIESNSVMAIGRYRGICDDILIAVNKNLYQETMIELDDIVDSSKIVVVDNYCCDAHAMAQVAERMRKTGMSTKTAICVRPILLDIGCAIYPHGDICDYVKKAAKVAERHENVVMAVADDYLVCGETLHVAEVGAVKLEIPDKRCDSFPINTVGVDHIGCCDAGMYFWRPSVYLDAIGRVKEAEKAHDTMARLASSLADLGTPVLTPCCLSQWRPIIEQYWLARIPS